MATSREVYSEDDNFIIGDDFASERLRREARQLHLSEFSRTRREAHFTRYRNSFLKCDLDQTIDRIEQGRKLRLAEMERACAALTKQEENRRKIRRESRNTIEKQLRKDSTREWPGSEIRVAVEDHQESNLSVASLSSSRTSSVEGKRDVAGKNELTTTTMPGRLHGTTSMGLSGDDNRSSSNIHADEQARERKNSIYDVSSESRANCGESEAEDVESKSCILKRRQRHERLSIAASNSSRASPVVGTRDLAGKQDKRLLSIAAPSCFQTSVAAGERNLAGKPGKRHSVATSSFSRASPVAEKTERSGLAGKSGKRHSVPASSFSRPLAVAGNQELAGKYGKGAFRKPSLHVTPSVDVENGRKSSFGSSLVIIEQGEQGENSTEGGAKSQLGDSGLLRVEKAVETDPDNGLAKYIKESRKRAHSTSVSESGSERSLVNKASANRISRVSRRRVSPGLTESQEPNAKKIQTQSAHERWIWKEFDKVMKGFADSLHVEHKTVNLKSKSEVVEKDTKPKNPPQNNMTPKSLNNSMIPLYFRYGVSDRIVFRC